MKADLSEIPTATLIENVKKNPDDLLSLSDADLVYNCCFNKYLWCFRWY